MKEITEEEKSKQREYQEQCRRLLKTQFPDRQPMCYLHSYGCQGNVADGERMKGILQEIGYSFCDTPEAADFVLFNTCAVRENAEDRVFGNLGILIHQKKKNPRLLIGLCGCMTQQPQVAQRVREHFPGVNLVFGTHALHRIPELMYHLLSGQKRVYQTEEYDGFIAEDLPVVRSSKFQASVPIMYGCNNFCTYCIVPYVRGRERSRRPEKILEEINGLLQNGCKEILLLGQNVNSYGKDLGQSVSFAELLRMINDLPGDFRIRFMTSHPKDITDELLDVMAQCDKVCKHLHLPVQSGSDRILKAMNRHYTAQDYIALVDRAKRKMPQLSLTSDIIVGFPGENYQDFQKTVDLIRYVQYTSLFTFIYSKREGTRAAELTDPVPLSQKTKWLQELIGIQNDISEAIHRRYLGTVQRILVDGISRVNPDLLTGRTDTHLVVDFPGNEQLIGKFVDVRITKAYRLALAGERIIQE